MEPDFPPAPTPTGDGQVGEGGKQPAQAIHHAAEDIGLFVRQAADEGREMLARWPKLRVLAPVRIAEDLGVPRMRYDRKPLDPVPEMEQLGVLPSRSLGPLQLAHDAGRQPHRLILLVHPGLAVADEQSPAFHGDREQRIGSHR